jgi:hypothetical protein
MRKPGGGALQPRSRHGVRRGLRPDLRRWIKVTAAGWAWASVRSAPECRCSESHTCYQFPRISSRASSARCFLERMSSADLFQTKGFG